jgi:hypothetical protein
LPKLTFNAILQSQFNRQSLPPKKAYQVGELFFGEVRHILTNIMNQQNLAVHMLNRLNHKVIAEAIQKLSEEQGKPECKGGVLAISLTSYNISLADYASISIGLPGKGFGHSARYAAEKIARLYDLRMEGSNDVAASQSANPSAGSYGGCIIFHGSLGDIYAQIYISFSGAPAEVDEAVVFVVGERLGLKAPTYSNPLLSRARELLTDAVL